MYPKNWPGDYDRMLCQDAIEEKRMTTQRKRYNAEFKARVTLEALKGTKSTSQRVKISIRPEANQVPQHTLASDDPGHSRYPYRPGQVHKTGQALWPEVRPHKASA